MSLPVGEINERENQLFPPLLVHFVSYFLVYYSLVGGKHLSFTMTAWVPGVTHSVLLAMNVILLKEFEESNPSLSFLIETFFEQL